MGEDPQSRKELVAGVILAGGMSRRMGGRDKALLELAGRPLVAHAIARLAPQAGAMMINANGDPARFATFGLPVVADPIAGFAGPLAGVLAGMEWAAGAMPEARWVVTVAADTPLFPPDLVARLAEAAGPAENRIALAASNGRVHPVFGLWPVALAADLRRWLTEGEERKVLAWVDRHAMVEVEFAAGDKEKGADGADPFFNINTPDDMATAESMLRETAS